jgi:hypothetical protein
MTAGLLRVVVLALGAAGVGGCATQQGTSQALTVVGAAAVVIGASMAADAQCYDGPAEGSALVYCAENTSKGVRNTGKAIAVAGVGLAAAGYALEPKGPDNQRRVRPDPDAAPASPYRLIRRDPPSEPPSEPAEPVDPPGDLVEPPTPCPPGATAGSAAGDCSPDRAPTAAPTRRER